MARLPKEIYDSINGRKINNPPEWYDYINDRYTCMTRDAFSGRLSVTKTFPKVAMADDWKKIISWAVEKKIVSLSEKEFSSGKITIKYDVDKNKIDRSKLYRNAIALVKYLSIPQKDRKELFRMFRISTITKTDFALHEHGEALNKVNTTWDQPSLITTLNLEKIKADQTAIRGILEDKIAYYKSNLEQFKENTKRYGYNYELPGLLKPVAELLKVIGFSKHKALNDICDLLLLFGIDADSYNLRHYLK